jgi:hypothetical protein
MTKTPLSIACLAVLAFSVPTLAEEWHELGNNKTLGISGIAVIDKTHFLVVHDNKKPDQPRLGLVEWQKGQQPTLTPLKWCDDTLPIDLEAVTAVPGHAGDYLVLESRGQVSRIQLEEQGVACKTLARFPLPGITPESNLEGLSLYCRSQTCKLLWAERGDDKTPANLSWAVFDPNKNAVSDNVGHFFFKAPYPETNLRSISDITVNQHGSVLVSAASDPGDDGPFKSAIYTLGKFSTAGVLTIAEPKAPDFKFDAENVKIEALNQSASGLLMGSDDENKGGHLALRTVGKFKKTTGKSHRKLT